MVISVLKKLKILFILFPAVFLLIYCEDPDDITRERSARRQSKEVSTIRSQSEDYYGRYNRSDYDGSDCEDLAREDEDYEKCMEICDKIYGKQAGKCEELPIKLIFDLDKLFTEMQNIRAEENKLNRRVSDFDFGVMIDIDVEPVLILMRGGTQHNGWSQREVIEFLLWTAKTSSVALALWHHDKEDNILEAAFKRLGESGSGGDRLERGIGADLQGYGKTFWAIAEDEKNKAAFIVLHRLVEAACSSRDCKLKLYCIREGRSDRFRSRNCHYSSSQRSFRQDYCYIHGPDVWSFWESLNREREIRDDDFPDDAVINEEECGKVCQRENCTRS